MTDSTDTAKSIPELEQEEAETWRVYLLCHVEASKLREKWKAAALKLGDARRATKRQGLCNTKSH